MIVSAQIESELAELPDEEATEYLASHGVAESGVGSLIRVDLPPARPAHLLHRRREGGPRLDDPRRRHGARSRRGHPQRLRARLHQGRDDRLAGVRPRRRLGPRPRRRHVRQEGKEYLSPTATSSSSSSTSEPDPRALGGARFEGAIAVIFAADRLRFCRQDGCADEANDDAADRLGGSLRSGLARAAVRGCGELLSRAHRFAGSRSRARRGL